LSYIPVSTILAIIKASLITRCLENSPFRLLAPMRIAKAGDSVKQGCTPHCMWRQSFAHR